MLSRLSKQLQHRKGKSKILLPLIHLQRTHSMFPMTGKKKRCHRTTATLTIVSNTSSSATSNSSNNTSNTLRSNSTLPRIRIPIYNNSNISIHPPNSNSSISPSNSIMHRAKCKTLSLPILILTLAVHLLKPLQISFKRNSRASLCSWRTI